MAGQYWPKMYYPLKKYSNFEILINFTQHNQNVTKLSLLTFIEADRFGAADVSFFGAPLAGSPFFF